MPPRRVRQRVAPAEPAPDAAQAEVVPGDPYFIPRAEPMVAEGGEAAAADDAEVPVDPHRWLDFEDALDRGSLQPLLARSGARGMEPLRFLRWDSLTALGLLARAEELCRPVWYRFFSIDQSAALELALEFFSTFHFPEHVVLFTDARAMTFRLGGEERQLSLREFGVLMGLYTEEELDTPMFTEGLIDFPEGVTVESFWAEIGEGVYSSVIPPKSTRIQDPLHRVLHRAIAHTICARRDSTGTITRSDLFYLFCIVSGRACQLAYCLAHYLSTIRTLRQAQPIYGAAYVTLIARHFGILTPEVTAALVFFPATPIDSTVFRNMRLFRMEGGRHVLLDGALQPWPRVVQEQEAVGAEAGPSGTGGRGTGTGGASTSGTGGQVQTPEVQVPVSQGTQGLEVRVEGLEREVSGLRQDIAGLRQVHRLAIARSEAWCQRFELLISPSTVPPPFVMDPVLAAFLSETDPVAHVADPPTGDPDV